MSLTDRLTRAGREFEGESGLSATDVDRFIERDHGAVFGFGSSHDKRLYYLGSDNGNYQSRLPLNYCVSSVRGMKLAERVTELRKAEGWSQAALASRAKVSQQLIAKIENGKVVETRKLPRIAEAFRLTVEQFLTGVAPTAVQESSTTYVIDEHAQLDEAQLSRAWSRLSAEHKQKLIQLANVMGFTAATDSKSPSQRNADISLKPSLGGAELRRKRKQQRDNAAVRGKRNAS